MAVQSLAIRRQAERRFFAVIAVVFPLLILLGFGRS